MADHESHGKPEIYNVNSRGLPRIINLAYDRGCNLACSYCRTELFNPKSAGYDVEAIHKNLFLGGLQGVERLVIAGNGDVCASKLYMNLLKNFDVQRYPNLRIKIQTNGLLFTRERWEKIAKCHSAIDWISVSIDAATKVTYRMNRGADFSRVLKCLEFLSELRRNGEIRLFYINFVVQANNFREMKQFINLGEKYGCDLVEFQCIENWGTYSDDRFAKIAIQHPSHPEHKEFLSYLDDEIFVRPFVYLYKLLDFVPDQIRRNHGNDDIVKYQSNDASLNSDVVRAHDQFVDCNKEQRTMTIWHGEL
jgi:MoaA/NifB/PqqE/SkfB family radical SAM enzyme